MIVSEVFEVLLGKLTAEEAEALAAYVLGVLGKLSEERVIALCVRQLLLQIGNDLTLATEARDAAAEALLQIRALLGE